MSSTARVVIHASQFPENIRHDLLESLRSRRINHKFHYDSIKQIQKWLALHEAFSPSRNDADCGAILDRCFAATAKRIAAPSVCLIGLGCGGGQKDSRLLARLRQDGKAVSYRPVDVSVAMVLVARQAAMTILPENECQPLVCDLATADDLPAVLESLTPAGATRLVTFFGMIPNFEPELILPRLAGLLRPHEWLLLSANLAPGPDYAAGVRHILPQYDNPLTRDWLLTFLLDLGVESSDGELRFTIEDDQAGTPLQRVTAYFHFSLRREVRLADEHFHFQPGEAMRLFFSYRHTPERIRSRLACHGIRVLDQWIAGSREEGVFLCRKER